MKIIEKIKDFLKKFFTTERIIYVCAIALLLLGILFLNMRYNKLHTKYDDAVQNGKAYASLLDEERNKSNVFQVTIEQLEYCNDSISKKLVETKNELKIKDKQIKELNYLYSVFTKTDTLILVDTIFKNVDFKLDTNIGDKWVNTHLTLEYPNVIEVTPSVKSEKVVAVYSKRETINPPKKFFLCRWFQKKHTVTKVVVDEKNPHITAQENVFYNISK